VLPIASRLLQNSDSENLKALVTRALWLCGALSIGVTVVVEVFLPLVLKLYLGIVPDGMLHILRILLLAVPPYCVFISFRGVIDAAYQRAINARLCYVSLMVFVVVSFVGRMTFSGVTPILVGFLAAIYSLGALCVLEILSLRGHPVESLE
jgi:Na+-driven multidrug efflux pump